MSRYIEADDYRKKWADIFDSAYGDSCCKMFKKSIDEQPTADVRENVHGEWISLDGYRCSRCNYKLQTTGIPSFCPNCGAEMRGEKNG